MADKKSRYELEIMIAGGTDRSLEASIKKARKELNSLERSAGLSGAGETFGGMSVKGINSLGKLSDQVFGSVVKGSKMAAAGVAGLLSASAVTGMGFESQMSTVQAIAQASESDMQKLTDLAKEMGETTQFTAEEAGQGLEYMASAGWTTQQMLDGLPGIMYLAAASGEDLALSSEIVTGALTAFGKGAGEASRFADVLAQAAAASNTDVAGLGGTLEYVAPVAGSLKYSYEDVAIAAGLMANANIKGEKAGTALRATLTNLAKPTEQMQGYMDELSLSLTDSNGKILSLRELLGDAREGFSKLSEAEKAEYAAGIAGKEGMSALLAIVNASQEDFDKLAEAIDHSTGAAQEMSKVRLDNLKGDLTILSSAAQGLGIEAYGGFSEELRELTQSATTEISNLTINLKENIPTIRRYTKDFGSDAQKLFAPILTFGEWSLEHPEVIKGTVVGITGALATFKGVQAAQTGIKLLGSFSSLISAWPVALAGAAIGSIVGISAAVKEHNRQLKKEDMSRRFGDITLSMEELDETAEAIVNNRNISKVTEALGELDKIKTLSGDFDQAAKRLDKLNWKIGMGFELDEGDKADYAAAIDQMIQGAIEIVEQSQYTAGISVQALFGGDSETGNQIIGIFNNMYESINSEVQDMGRQLGEAYSNAMEDGIVDPIEAETIQKLMTQFAEITRQVSQAQFNAKIDRISMQAQGNELDPEMFKNLQSQMAEVLTEQETAALQNMEALLANVNMAFSTGTISEDELENQKDKIYKQYQDQISYSRARSVQWSTDSITSAYQDVINDALPDIYNGMDKAMADAAISAQTGGNMVLAFDPRVIQDQLGLDQIKQEARDGIAELWEGMELDYDRLQQEAQKYYEAGRELPQELADGLLDASIIGAIAGNKEALWQMLGMKGSQNPEYQKAIQEAQESGAYIPETVSRYLLGNQGAVIQATNELGNTVERILNERFDGLSVDGTVDFNLTPKTTLFSGINSNNGKKPEKYADGGLITRPTLSWFAEESPEMAIPIDGSKRAMGLWRQAGELLGAYDQANYGRMAVELDTAGAASSRAPSGPVVSPVFSPVIQVQSGENVREQVMEGLNISYQQFVEYMERFQREQYRAAL